MKVCYLDRRGGGLECGARAFDLSDLPGKKTGIVVRPLIQRHFAHILCCPLFLLIFLPYSQLPLFSIVRILTVALDRLANMTGKVTFEVCGHSWAGRSNTAPNATLGIKEQSFYSSDFDASQRRDRSLLCSGLQLPRPHPALGCRRGWLGSGHFLPFATCPVSHPQATCPQRQLVPWGSETRMGQFWAHYSLSIWWKVSITYFLSHVCVSRIGLEAPVPPEQGASWDRVPS